MSRAYLMSIHSLEALDSFMHLEYDGSHISLTGPVSDSL
ncbi:hypothetical protein SCARR_01128 [Pontiella sulfatireligans]|uniref:Uncharacterized protein n=1 Tax=Pontiella sulfatireligans TaxID=2750658 RepID=A0A6C2UFT3_9BACT|nr:hypothetical protein SCARR_01128 [Pontiella sulfatireligans]